jgi:hypothetical protein
MQKTIVQLSIEACRAWRAENPAQGQTESRVRGRFRPFRSPEHLTLNFPNSCSATFLVTSDGAHIVVYGVIENCLREHLGHARDSCSEFGGFISKAPTEARLYCVLSALCHRKPGFPGSNG